MTPDLGRANWADVSGVRLHRAEGPDLLKRIAGSNGTRALGSEGVLADHIWDDAGRWLVVADGDLASTYCGTDEQVSWPPGLEWAAVDTGPPLG